MFNLILTIIIGIIGGSIALRLKVPAGGIVGSMVLVGIFSIMTGDAFIPTHMKVLTQMAAGAFIGASITRKDVLDLKFIVKPAILMVVCMIVLDLFMGYIMYKLTNLDLVTCLFATAPGGLVDMSLISDDMGADTSKVAVLQLIRILCVLLFFPTMMKFISDRLGGKEKSDGKQEESAATDLTNKSNKKNKDSKGTSSQNAINLTITMILAGVTGLIGYLLKVPAGALTFAMVAVGILNVTTNRGFMPLNIRRLTQMLAGALIGSRITYADVVSLKLIIVPVVILLIGIILVNLCIGILINRLTKLELITSLLASAPGGLSDMALIAKDLGGDAPKVAVLQLVRYVSVIAIFPILIKLISS